MHFCLPENFPKKINKKSTVIGSLLFFFFLISWVIFSPMFVAASGAANLYISPVTGSYMVGDKVTLKIMVASQTSFNAVSGSVLFPTSLFSIDSISKSGSVLSFWVTEPNANAGVVKFEGVALGGSGGLSGGVVTVNLHATKAGSGTVSFKSGQVLANDGQGTDITGALTSATFTVKEGAPKSVPTPVLIPEPLPETPQPKPSLLAPEIVYGTKYGAPAILGTSEYPKAQVLVTFVATDGAKVFILGSADIDGSFNLLIPNSLKRGTYNVTAVMVKDDKTNSSISNEIEIEVGNLYSDLGWQILLLLLLLVLTVIYLILRIFIHFGANKKDRDLKSMESGEKKDFKDAEAVIHKSFQALRSDVASRSAGIVSQVERSNIEALEKDIESTEKVIDKEIKEIELK